MAREREAYDPADYCECGTRIASGRHGPTCAKRESPYVPPVDPEAKVLVAAPVVPVAVIEPEVMPAQVAEAQGQSVVNVRVSGKWQGRLHFEITE